MSYSDRRYGCPAELDPVARLAEMALEQRRGGWDREPITALGPAHLSVNEKS
jgi:hypothetical protein